jgi:transposase
MLDTELYRHLLGIESPWKVTKVVLSVREQKVDVWVAHPRGVEWPCPECGVPCHAYDHADERSWRHLDSCQFLTFLHARPPRLECGTHGVRQARLPWAEEHSRFTALFEKLAIMVLLETSVKGAAAILRISWDEAWTIVEKAVERGLARKGNHGPERIGVDEKAMARGQSYCTIVCDLDRGNVEHVEEKRTQESFESYLRSLGSDGLARIKVFAMDMWPPYIAAVRATVPQADEKIVFDRYHIASHMGKAVDKVRSREHRELREMGDETLTGSKYLWLWNLENVPEDDRARFRRLRAADLKTARAWAIKENLRLFWNYLTVRGAERFWQRWYFWATHSRLTPVIKVAKMIKRHLPNVLTYFRHHVTNATAEGLNSLIETVRKRAAGFRSKKHFKTAIYFHCGGLNLYPTQLPHGNV